MKPNLFTLIDDDPIILDMYQAMLDLVQHPSRIDSERKAWLSKLESANQYDLAPTS